MLDKIRIKIRALIEDLAKSDFETFTYTNSSIFNLAESNIGSISKVLKNGVELGSGDYFYDSTTNKIEIIIALVQKDIIEVDYTFTRYSDTELTEYIRGSLVHISVFAYSMMDLEIEENTIQPTPDKKTTDLVALISSILIKPDYTRYSLPTMTVVYNGRLTKDQKIEKLISRFKMGLGVNKVITIN